MSRNFLFIHNANRPTEIPGSNPVPDMGVHLQLIGLYTKKSVYDYVCVPSTENVCYCHCLTDGVNIQNGLDMYILSPITDAQFVSDSVNGAYSYESRNAYK
jgi:hypothetical protein